MLFLKGRRGWDWGIWDFRLGPFHEDVSWWSYELFKSITHGFLVTISVGPKFALDPSVTVCFAGEFVWKGHAWARQLISERWKDAPSPVDAAFRYDQNSVLLIKVRLDPGQGQARSAGVNTRNPPPGGPCQQVPGFLLLGLPFLRKVRLGVCVCVCVCVCMRA